MTTHIRRWRRNLNVFLDLIEAGWERDLTDNEQRELDRLEAMLWRKPTSR